MYAERASSCGSAGVSGILSMQINITIRVTLLFKDALIEQEKLPPPGVYMYQYPKIVLSAILVS